MPGAASLPFLIPDGLFLCPRCGSSGAVPSAKLIWAGALGSPLAGFCNRCEHHYQFTLGTPSTTTSGAANVQGATVLTVTLGTGFISGSWVAVDAASADGGAEIVKASGAGTSTTIPIASSPLRLAHAAGASVQTAVLVLLGPLT